MKFTAFGMPATQGNKSAFYKAGMKRAVLVEQRSERLKSWRSVVADAAAAAMNGAPLFDSALELRVTFYFPRPKSAPKSRVHPEVKPDGDKLVRAIADAVTGVCWTDDARVCDWIVRKRYGEPARAEVEVAPL